MNHPELKGRKFAGKSFDSYDKRVTPYWESHAGHGTLMARLILRMCPTAVIYVIKTKTVRESIPWIKDPLDPNSCIQVRTHPSISSTTCV